MRIVAAQANDEQAGHFYELAQMAADDLFSELVGGRAAPMLQAMYLRGDNDLSHACAHFLVVDDAIAGMLHAYPARQAKVHEMRTLWLYLRFARWGALRFLLVALALRQIMAFLGQNLEDDDFYISFLAVYPQYRGRGYSKALLAHALELAQGFSCSRLVLDVDERNTVARAAYERVGFQQVDESDVARLGDEEFRILRLAKPVQSSS